MKENRYGLLCWSLYIGLIKGSFFVNTYYKDGGFGARYSARTG